jgi:hypothetical protein
MRRAAATALAVLAVSACGPAPAPLVDVSVYWEFDRNTFIDGATGFVPYDVNVNWPPGTGNRSCPESGVDYVTITDGAGNLLADLVPCVNQSVQGALLVGVPGPNTYVVTGWNDGSSQPWYQGAVTVNVVAGAFNYGTAIASGIPSDLTIDMVLRDSFNPLGYPTCGLAGVNRFQGWVEDGFGTLVWRNPVDCGPGFSPSIQYGPVDRDFLTVWIDTYDDRVVPPDVPWSICGYGFMHDKTDLFDLVIPLGLCTNPPPPP